MKSIHHLIFSIFVFLSAPQFSWASDLNIADIKSCMSGMNLSFGAIATQIPGGDQNAYAFSCQEPSMAKISSDFSADELKKGTPIQAPQSQILLYVTDQGLRFAEYPTFYYFVFYHDASNTVDVGVLPNHVLPIQLPGSEPAFIAEEGEFEGKMFPVSSLSTYSKMADVGASAASLKTGFLDRYAGMLTQANLPPVTLDANTSLTPDQVKSCILNPVKEKIWLLLSASGTNLDYKTYQPTDDEEAASRMIGTDPDGLAKLKVKYQMTADQWVQLYVSRIQAIVGCNSILTDSDQKEIVQKGLADILPGYIQTKQYLDNI